MFAVAALCPHPPLLVPQLAAGAAAELDDLRAACDRAVGALLAASPARILVIGGGSQDVRGGPELGGSMCGYGVDVHAGSLADESLPLSLTVGAWLLQRAGCAASVRFLGYGEAATPGGSDIGARDPGASAPDLPDRRLAEWADRVAAEVTGPEPVAVLAMGDLSARRSTAAPGYLDDRAAGFDRAVVRALASPDPAVLRGLDAALAGELWVAGLPALVGLAACATADPGQARDPDVDTAPGLSATIHYDDAPYGVGYVVATWQRPRSAG